MKGCNSDCEETNVQYTRRVSSLRHLPPNKTILSDIKTALCSDRGFWRLPKKDHELSSGRKIANNILKSTDLGVFRGRKP